MPAGTRRARKARSGGAKSFHSVDGSLGTDEVAGQSDELSVMGSANILYTSAPFTHKDAAPDERAHQKKRVHWHASICRLRRLQRCAAECRRQRTTGGTPMKIGQVLLIVAVVGTGVAGALARSPERGFGSMADPVDRNRRWLRFAS